MQITNQHVKTLKTAIHLLGITILLALLLFGWLTRPALELAGWVFPLCGFTALSFLLLTLCVTPLVKILRAPTLIKLRRICGLWSFTFACAHALILVGLRLHFDVIRLWEIATRRPFIALGLLTFFILLLLAATSSQAAMRLLGHNWVRLHRLIYLAVVLGCIHFWLASHGSVLAVAYAGLAALLLILRIPKVKRLL